MIFDALPNSSMGRVYRDCVSLVAENDSDMLYGENVDRVTESRFALVWLRCAPKTCLPRRYLTLDVVGASG